MSYLIIFRANELPNGAPARAGRAHPALRAAGLAALATVTLFSTSPAFADAKYFYAQRAERMRRHGLNPQKASDLKADLAAADPVIPPLAPTLVSGVYDQRLNPGDESDLRTFAQRYFLETKYASGPDAPVIYYICGEATCSPFELDGQVATEAKLLGARIVTLEHRYYGKSMPFPTLATENLRFLSTDFALGDLRAFQRYAQASLGLTGRWITYGGSYAGVLSALYRQRFPADVAGALASSAPMQARENFEQYDQHVNAVAGPACADAVRAAVKTIESGLADSVQRVAVRQAFAAEAVTDDADFLAMIADVAAYFVQYGHQAEFCGGMQAATDRIATYGKFAQDVYKDLNTTALGFSNASAFSLNPDDYLTSYGLRAWLYQSCNEYGFFQNAFHDPAQSMRSARVNGSYAASLCTRLFGITAPVPIDATNARQYAPFSDPQLASAILFTNGANDPWSKLSLTAENGNATNASLSFFTIQGASHCQDLGPAVFGDSLFVQQARKLFDGLAATWLK